VHFLALLLVGRYHHHYFVPTAVSDTSFEKNKKLEIVALGNHQCPGIDYGESCSSVMRLESLRTLLALSSTG